MHWGYRKSCFKFITMTSQQGQWRLKSPASPLFAQPFVHAQIKKNIKAPCHWPFWEEPTGDQWIPLTKGQYREKNSFWWRHHTSICRYHTWVSLSCNRYSLTLMANIFPTESQDGVIVFYDIDGDEGISFRMYEATGDSIGLRLTLVERGQSPDLDGIVIATEGLTLNQWNHVTATYDYNSGDVNLYIDGVTVVTDVSNRCKTERLSHWLPFVTEGVGLWLSHLVTIRLFNWCYHNCSVSVFFNII